MEGYIFDIKHFAVHDGPGIRTTVFLKGCPLKCVWCHNPESILTEKQLGFIEHKCVSCGACVAVCPEGAHYFDEQNTHKFDRSKCVSCGKCTDACRVDALTLYGKYMSPQEILNDVMDDIDFYESSGGGVTLSGGECLMQPDFCVELLKKLKDNGIHTAVDTCGFVSKATLDKVIPYTDIFLYDLKAIDEDVHVKCTSQPNKVILENLKYIDNLGCKTEIRIPFVPGYNDGEIEKMGEFLSTLNNVTGVRVLAYHNYAGTKYKSLDMENTMPQIVPTPEQVENARKQLASMGVNVLE